jgi:hypothetical protein
LRLQKALYGCVNSALLWYELFTGTLQGMGSELTPYDMCVANKTVDEKQCISAWYVDDNKISHVDPEVVTDVVDKIEERFGKITITQGKEHVFWGMNITYLDNRTAKISMQDCVKESIAKLGECVNKTAASPSKRDLCENCEKSKMLEKTKGEIFHSIDAKLLYISHRGRLDIQLPIALRVSCSTNQDWTKWKRVLEYLNGTLEDV